MVPVWVTNSSKKCQCYSENGPQPAFPGLSLGELGSHCLVWDQPDSWLGNVGSQGLGVLPKIPFLGPSQGIQTPLRLGYRCPWLGGTVCWWGSWNEEGRVILETAGRQGRVGAATSLRGIRGRLAWKEVVATRVVVTEVEVALRQAPGWQEQGPAGESWGAGDRAEGRV